jgi:peroxiredoxin
VVLGINIQEAPDLVKAYVAKHHLTFAHLLDAEARVASMFGVPGTPTTFFVDRSGHVVAGGAGYRDWASPAVSQLVESLLKTTDSKTEQR